jgi:hypothetical protein
MESAKRVFKVSFVTQKEARVVLDLKIDNCTLIIDHPLYIFITSKKLYEQ